MDDLDAGPSVLPARAQRLLAVAVGGALVAMAGWYVARGGLARDLVHHDAAPAAPGPGFTVQVNSAGEAELAQLPGLGPATARRIVEHRREHGPFANAEELLAVPGIGPATLERMRPHLRPIRNDDQPPTPPRR